jgi:GTPase-associated system helical domain
MSALQKLLDVGLVDIDSDDTRFAKMQSASSSFAIILKENPSLLIQATLIAIDEEVAEDDPTLEQVEELVRKEWPTMRNTHVNRPRVLLRSITIDALDTVIDNNPEIAGIFWNTAACYYKHEQTRFGKSAHVVEQMLKDANQTAEKEAIKRAELAAPLQKKRKKKSSTPEPVTLDLDGRVVYEDLLTDIEAASGPSNINGETLKSANPNWPNSGGATWSYDFASRMTKALVKSVNLGTERLANSLSESLSSYLNAFERRLIDRMNQTEQCNSEFSELHASSRMRLDVLWWSEALYSPLLCHSYREMNLSVAAVAAAVDLTKIVPALCPASVYYILAETVLRLSRILGINETKPLMSYLNDLAEATPDLGEALPCLSTNSDANKQRLPLLHFVGEASAGVELSSDALCKHAGIESTLNLSAGDFAMWVFRDLQARRLVEELR